MSESIFAEIESQLTNGWGVELISTVTPGIVRIQLGTADHTAEDTARACVEGKTPEEAIQNAILFTANNPYAKYASNYWEAMAHAFDGPDCRCPQCSKELSFIPEEDDYHTMSQGWSQFMCSRCGTTSIWELDTPFPILVETHNRGYR